MQTIDSWYRCIEESETFETMRRHQSDFQSNDRKKSTVWSSLLSALARIDRVFLLFINSLHFIRDIRKKQQGYTWEKTPRTCVCKAECSPLLISFWRFVLLHEMFHGRQERLHLLHLASSRSGFLGQVVHLCLDCHVLSTERWNFAFFEQQCSLQLFNRCTILRVLN